MRLPCPPNDSLARMVSDSQHLCLSWCLCCARSCGTPRPSRWPAAKSPSSTPRQRRSMPRTTTGTCCPAFRRGCRTCVSSSTCWTSRGCSSAPAASTTGAEELCIHVRRGRFIVMVQLGVIEYVPLTLRSSTGRFETLGSLRPRSNGWPPFAAPGTPARRAPTPPRTSTSSVTCTASSSAPQRRRRTRTRRCRSSPRPRFQVDRVCPSVQ